uniref:Uncharacterized protein n=1 Tax=Anopheles atroparvus TaxID=41427 RepID=A0AAG5DRV1_ANOAO
MSHGRRRSGPHLVQHPGMEGHTASRSREGPWCTRNPANSSCVIFAFGFSPECPLTCAQDRLLGPCFKTGPEGTSISVIHRRSGEWSPMARCRYMPQWHALPSTRVPCESITHPTVHRTRLNSGRPGGPPNPPFAAQAF